MPDFRCGYVDIASGQVHYRRAGDAGPWIFLFHQTPLSSRMYEPTLPELGRHARAVAFDTPGYGGSTPPDGVTTVTDYATRLLAAIDSFTTGPFAIVGVATGTAVSLEIARLAQHRVTHAVFSGAPLLTPERMAHFRAQLGEPDARADGSHLLQVWQSRRSNWGDEAPLDQMMMAASETLRVYDRLNWGLLAVTRYDVRAALEALRCPVLFISAGFDKLAPENAAAAAVVKHSVQKIVPGVPPQLCWTAPREYAREILAFVGAG